MGSTIKNRDRFGCIVAGENPEVILGPYDTNKKAEKPYVKFSASPESVKKLRQHHIMFYEALLKNPDLTDDEKFLFQENLNAIKSLSDYDFFNELTEGYEHDPETGDAMTTENPNGRYSAKCVGKAFTIPFYTNDGREVFQARKGEINWEAMHRNERSRKVYETVWETVIEGREPADEHEKQLFENMKNRTFYLLKHGSKEMYVTAGCSFWQKAFLSEETGWVEIQDNENQFAWMSEYYDRYIKDLPDDTLLTIYECVR